MLDQVKTYLIIIHIWHLQLAQLVQEVPRLPADINDIDYWSWQVEHSVIFNAFMNKPFTDAKQQGVCYNDIV